MLVRARQHQPAAMENGSILPLDVEDFEGHLPVASRSLKCRDIDHEIESRQRKLRPHRVVKRAAVLAAQMRRPAARNGRRRIWRSEQGCMIPINNQRRTRSGAGQTGIAVAGPDGGRPETLRLAGRRRLFDRRHSPAVPFVKRIDEGIAPDEVSETKHPRVAEWWTKIQARPAFARAKFEPFITTF